MIASGFRTAIAWAGLMAISPSTPAAAQWFHYPTPGVPKTVDGLPNLKAPTPKTSDGKPDFSGLWLPQGTSSIDDKLQPSGVFNDVGSGVKGGAPYQPWAAELVRKRNENNRRDTPDSKCLPLSPMLRHTLPAFRRMVQTPGMLLILDEHWTNFRTIYTDGRPLPVDPQPSWLGYSTGKWDGDTLVVQTIGLKDDTYPDGLGSPMTSGGKMTERFRRTDYGNLDIQITIDDPKAYTRPWTITVHQAIVLDTDLLEGFCDNEKDQAHLVGK